MGPVHDCEEAPLIGEDVDAPDCAVSGMPDVRAACHDRPNVLTLLRGWLSSLAAWSARNRPHAVFCIFMSAPAACFKLGMIASVWPIQPLYAPFKWIISALMQSCHGHGKSSLPVVAP